MHFSSLPGRRHACERTNLPCADWFDRTHRESSEWNEGQELCFLSENLMHHRFLRVSPSRSGCWWVVVVRPLLRWVVLEEAPDRGSRYGPLQPPVGVPVVCFLLSFITRLSCATVGERAAQDAGLVTLSTRRRGVPVQLAASGGNRRRPDLLP